MKKTLQQHSFATNAQLPRFAVDVTLDLVLFAQFFAVLACGIVAKLVYIDYFLSSSESLEKYIAPLLVCPAIFCFILHKNKYTRKERFLEREKDYSSIVVSLVTAFLALIVIGHLFKEAHQFSRAWMFIWFVSSLAVSLWFWRFTFGYVDQLIAQGRLRNTLAIYGPPELAQRFAERAKKSDPTIFVTGLYWDPMRRKGRNAAASAQPPVRHDGSLEDLVRDGQRVAPDHVVIILSPETERLLRSIELKLGVLPSEITVFPAQFENLVRNAGFRRVGGLAVVQLATKPITGWDRIVKTAEDYILGGLALALAAIPMAIIALAIKLDSKGPVFFRQQRHGYNHREISVWKFRTMTVMENGDNVVQATKNDQRVTRVGRFLRKTSLDELPQLINVMKGEMSLVGPRPHALVHNRYYSEMIEEYANRHRVKPGITGWAQVNGFRGPTDDPEKMRRRAELDLYYIDNWSIWFDLKILMLTPLLGFVNRNAF